MSWPGRHRTRRAFFRFRRRDRVRPLRRVALLPTLLTLGNGVCGMLAILAAFRAQPVPAAWLLFLAMVFDALDGRVARAMGIASKFGAQLDSLCDLVSFGVAPAVLVWAVCRHAELPGLVARLITVAAVCYACAVALRLARFNLETTDAVESHNEFAGLPSPAAAGVVASTILLDDATQPGTLYSHFVGALPIVLVVLSLLMLSRLPYAHVVNKFLRGLSPFVWLTELMLVAVLVVAFHEAAFFIGFVAYALAGPVGVARGRARIWLKARRGMPVPEGVAAAPPPDPAPGGGPPSSPPGVVP